MFLPFWPPKRFQNSNLTWSSHHNLGVPDIFCFLKFLIWPLLGPEIWDLNLFGRFCVFLPFWPPKCPQKSNLTWSAMHNLGVPNIFCFKKFLIWALLGPQIWDLYVFWVVFSEQVGHRKKLLKVRFLKIALST